jgi:hypothetical protein
MGVDKLSASAQLELLAVQRARLFGADHLTTLTTWFDAANLAAQGGDIARAAELMRKNAADKTRVLGPHSWSTLRSRDLAAYYLGRSGDQAAAIQEDEPVIDDLTELAGADHPRTAEALQHLAEISSS